MVITAWYFASPMTRGIRVHSHNVVLYRTELPTSCPQPVYAHCSRSGYLIEASPLETLNPSTQNPTLRLRPQRPFPNPLPRIPSPQTPNPKPQHPDGTLGKTHGYIGLVRPFQNYKFEAPSFPSSKPSRKARLFAPPEVCAHVDPSVGQHERQA